MKVLILGGGPAGCAAAWYLKQKGINNITIIEKDEAGLGGCSRTSFYHDIPYEFGPQVLYTDEKDIQEVFEKWLVNRKPPTEDGEFHPKVFPYGAIDDPHDFPITVANIFKLKNPSKAIYELYKINLDKPDFSNFEAYMISRIGKTLYDTYVGNYNVKHWKMNPSEMSADWAKERTLTLRARNDMFQGKWQGHPGDYTPLWKGLTEGCEIIKGEASISADMATAYVDGKEYPADLVISTLPLGGDMDYVHTCKVFIGVKRKEFLMPSYANSFPNNYNFTRIMEYKQQYYVDSEYSLINFAFPWNKKTGLDEKACVEEAEKFVKDILKRDIKDTWVEVRKWTYPVHTRNSEKLLEEKLNLVESSKIVPMGRCGIHCYVSKDTCLRMARIVANHMEDILRGGKAKRKVLGSLREKIR